MAPSIRFNPCSPCCDPAPYAYFWFICSPSVYESQFDFEGCDITCFGDDYEGEYEETQLTGNLLSGGMNFNFRTSNPQNTSTVLCVLYRQWGWYMEALGDGPEYLWRMSPYTLVLNEGVISMSEADFNPYGIGPYEAYGTVEDLTAEFNDETGEWEGGIWLQNQQPGASCARRVPDEMLLLDGRQASQYLEISGIGPFGP